MESVVIIADSSGKGFGFANGVYDYARKKGGRDFLITLSDIERTRFKDGEYKLKILQNIRQKKCFFIHDSNKDATEWFTDLVFILEAMKSSSPAEINVVLPYMRFSRQDRKDASRTGVSAKAVADIISLYADRGMTIDLHAPQIQEFFNIPFDDLRSTPVVVSYLIKKHPDWLNELVLVSPDAGGGKRVEDFQKRMAKQGIATDLAVCYKRRTKDDEVADLKVMGDVKDKNCLIVDDIIDTGGSLVRTGAALKQQGCKKIIAYGTHGLFTDGFGKFEIFEKVLTSDSLNGIRHGENLEVISLIDLFGEAVCRTIEGESLSSLFE